MGLRSHESCELLSVSVSVSISKLSGARAVALCVYLCVCLCVCVSVSASHASFTHSHTPNTLDYAVKPCPLPTLHPVCSIIIHSFLYSLSLLLSLYRLFGWSNVQVTFDNYYWNMFCINIIIMLMWGLNLVLSNGWLLVGFTF